MSEKKVTLADLSPAAGARGDPKAGGPRSGLRKRQDVGQGSQGPEVEVGRIHPSLVRGRADAALSPGSEEGFKPLRRVENQVVNVSQLARAR